MLSRPMPRLTDRRGRQNPILSGAIRFNPILLSYQVMVILNGKSGSTRWLSRLLSDSIRLWSATMNHIDHSIRTETALRNYTAQSKKRTLLCSLYLRLFCISIRDNHQPSKAFLFLSHLISREYNPSFIPRFPKLSPLMTGSLLTALGEQGAPFIYDSNPSPYSKYCPLP